MTVTIPIHIKNVHELRKSMGYKRKTEQNVTVTTRQYPITKVLRWRVTECINYFFFKVCVREVAGSDPILSVVSLRSLKEVPSDGQMIREENAYAMSGDAESRIRETGFFVNTSSEKAKYYRLVTDTSVDKVGQVTRLKQRVPVKRVVSQSSAADL